MCGIVGVARFDNGRISTEMLRRMVGQIRHRGPDASGIYINEQTGNQATTHPVRE